ncbi:MSHA biogenesis protein MshQ [Shewanella sp. D64]|uniref:DUF6701 domain-containing protein n=1 Tax=unclassified Shewanella TaxID=196818 RepID=UPI0022BA1B0E|nr:MULTISPECIES: DUF6701 domain-containing protein [unclassified Shewanella]MEC4725453.1 MSHA biogenesis protein MshQ [Shewanella sp. D64]MEC4738728.1 MSHA biogenesis protein MshQ [Shewanella sp. E94]WBJ95022.1 MSHA biogenesis protein MshQ [Shewanella sp. MTB7]
MINIVRLIILTILLLPTMAIAVPQCDEVFTDPPTGNLGVNGLTPPINIGPSLGNLTCSGGGCSGHSSGFTPGDYDFDAGSFNNSSSLSTNGETTRLYFDSLSLNNSTLNDSGDTEDLIIYVRGSLSVAGNNRINGIVYVAGSVSMAGNAKIDGALASAGALSISGNGEVDFEDDAIEDADFGGMCTNVQSSFNFQFGKAFSGTVTFDKPFETGVTPIIFLMPTISTNNPDSTDGPASVFPANITNTGFTWSQEEPVSPASRYKASLPMAEVHWIAVTPGEHTLSDGTELVAKVINQNRAFGVNNSPYTNIPLDSDLDVFLHQKQTSINNCWLTTTSQFYNSGAQLAMEASEVRSGNRCRPGYINSLQNEEVGYLAIESGTGTFNFDGDEIIYQFGRNYRTAPGTGDLSYQCGSESTLTGFSNIPTLVSGKNSRRGGDGGWLRRCKLTNNRVSMVTDEDTYRDTDRRHVYEFYSFVALEKKEQELTCFNDDFSQGDLTDNWVVARSNGNFTPAIVNGRLRQTQDVNNQSTSATYQRLFPAAENLVVVEFDHFAYGGSGADGIAVVLSDARITPQPGAFGGPLGYGFKPGLDGFAGGWLGVGIDEYGNFSGEGGSSNIGQRRQSVAVRGSGSGTSGYRYLKGACNNGTTNTNGNCLNPKVDDNNGSPIHRYRITVDSRVAGESMVEIQRKTSGGFVSIVPAFNAVSQTGQAVVPQDFILSLTGSTGGSDNVHEIDNIEICALESRPVGVVIDHFELTHSGSALTCSPENVTIKACADAACTQTIQEEVVATLTPATVTGGGGWSGTGVVGNQVTFSGGTAQIQLSRTTIGNVTMEVTGSIPGAKPFSQTLCRIGNSTPSVANCTLTYADSGFVFGDITAIPNNGIPDEFSNKPSMGILVHAVKTDGASQQCIANFANETKSVAFWSSYTDPSTGSKKVSVKSGTTTIDAGLSLATSVPLNLAFNAQGQATVDVNYADAGQMTLNARYTGTGDDAGLVMNGADTFVRYPKGLCVLPETTCAAGDAGCPPFKKAGESFTFDVQAMAWASDSDADLCDNLSTPNYAHQDVGLNFNLVAPSSGVDADQIADYDHVVSTDGANTLTRAVSEVGVFTITANPPSLYFGVNRAIESGISDPIGRFFPAHFELSNWSILPACSNTFSYMEQPFSLMMTLSAKNVEDVITTNYFGAFAKATASLVAANNLDGINRGARLSGLSTLAWPISDTGGKVRGKVDIVDNIKFSRLGNTLDGPYQSLDIGVVMDDGEGGTHYSFIKDPDMNAASVGACSGAGCNARNISTQDLRYGRMVLENGYGPESESLRVPLRTEYVSAVSAGVATWVTNTDDSCSVYNTLTSVDTAETATMGLNMAFPVGFPAINAYTDPTLIQQVGTLGNGLDYIYFSVPNNSGIVPLKQHVEPWLKWYWNYEGNNPSGLYDPRASVYFGTYRGNDKVIYWREVN